MLLALMLVLTSSTLPAQDFDTATVFGRVMQRRSDRIRQNPALHAAGGQINMTEADMSRLGDYDLVRVAGLIFQGILGPHGDCTNSESRLGLGIQDMLNPGMDSLEAESWAGVMERVAALGTDSIRPRLTATPEQASALFQALYRHSAAKEQLAFDKAATIADTTPCRLLSWLMDRIMIKPPAIAAPIVRHFFAMGQAQRKNR